MAECGTPLDDRINAEVFALNQHATETIPKWFEGVQIEMAGGMPVRCEETWVAYLAAEMYNNADTALIAIAHNRGRTARLLERQMYEALVKACYYVANPESARFEYLAMPFRDKRLAEQMRFDPASPRFKSIESAVSIVSKKFPEVVAYVSEHRKEIDLRSMVGPQDDPEADFDYAFRFRRLSQTAHGAVTGMHDVFDYTLEGAVRIQFDGRLPDPTFAVESMTLLLLRFLDLINTVFHLGKGAELEKFWTDNAMLLKRLWPEESAEAIIDDAAPKVVKNSAT